MQCQGCFLEIALRTSLSVNSADEMNDGKIDINYIPVPCLWLGMLKT